jgi:ketopantoate reductase
MAGPREAMKANGLHITMPEEEIHAAVQAFHICELSAIKPQLDIIFLVKSYRHRWMVHHQAYLRPGGLLVSVQNSLNNDGSLLSSATEKHRLRL